MSRRLITIVFYLAMAVVIGGHVFFAVMQACNWDILAGNLTDMSRGEIEASAFLGRSIASYNVSIALGLGLSFLLPKGPRARVQYVVLALIVATAAVGAAGTKGNDILLARLLPAAIALAALLWVRRQSSRQTLG